MFSVVITFLLSTSLLNDHINTFNEIILKQKRIITYFMIYKTNLLKKNLKNNI
jgi:hypothetical protein